MIVVRFVGARAGEDVVRVQLALLRAGYLVTPGQAYDLWLAYSASREAPWLTLPEDGTEIPSLLQEVMEPA